MIRWVIAGLSTMSGNFMLWSEIKSVQVLKYGAVNDPQTDTDVFGFGFQWGRGVRILGKTCSLTLKLHHGDNVPAIGRENKERKQLTKN